MIYCPRVVKGIQGDLTMKRRDFMKAGLISAGGMGAWSRAAGFPSLAPSRERSLADGADVIIKVLGTAQDAGIPQVGCYCPNCERARKNPRFARLKPSIAVLDMKDKTAFIVDASPDIGQQFDLIHERMDSNSAVKVSVPHAILLTHAHIGHYTGLMYYGYEGFNAEGIPVFCTARMAGFLEENGPWSQLVRLKNIAIQEFSPDAKISLTERISFIPLLVPHRDEYSDTVGFIIAGPRRKLLYIPDIQNWKAWDRSVVAEVEKVDYTILDGTFFSPDELPGRDLSKIGHPFITDSMDVLSATAKSEKCKIYFTHLNHSNRAINPAGPERKEITARGFRLAADGMELSL
jgi:pyrroloquinoline quinone biosynthesis protein B